tara:strand:+ start:219 stop:2000 length:1782 start_codon:yes stop_codon:yes gene_type:complete
MKEIEKEIYYIVQKFIQNKFEINIDNLDFQPTRKDFKGDITLLIFPLLKKIKANPEKFGNSLGHHIKSELKLIEDYSLVKGFLNLKINNSFYISFLKNIENESEFGHLKPSKKSPLIIVEYSSPNTNKPLHLGHIRNNLLGYSVAEILKANGKNVIKTQIINDRGIHICKSMIAWQIYGDNKTPKQMGIKGDQFVGKYYVLFNEKYNSEIKQMISDGHSEEYAKDNASIFLKAKELLKRWELNDKEVIKKWTMMNNWVYEGFEKTYNELGVNFDSYYYESETYLLGKKIIEKGLYKNLFYKKEDGSVWVDLKKQGLDEKLLLRSDGTSVYITQDLGLAFQRVIDNPGIDGVVYTVGNEQDYHFKVLFLILNKLGYSWSKNLFHLSYGMVDLPTGKMKSREGTVVDADDLILSMYNTAKKLSKENKKADKINKNQQEKLFSQIGLGALKYSILKVDPKKRILFNPEASFDFNGNSGPFIQYAYARIKSILRNAEKVSWNPILVNPIDSKEKELLKQLIIYPTIVKTAGDLYSPAIIANYLYDLVKLFNSFYQNITILGESNVHKKGFRLLLAEKVGQTIFNSSSLLGIEVPERM